MSRAAYHEYTDEYLFALLKDNDKAAYATIFDRYWDKLFAVASNKMDNPFLAEDVVQELFVDIWKNREKIEIHKTVNVYLAAALKYKVIKARLKAAKEKDERHSISRLVKTEENFSAQDKLSFSELQKLLEKLVRSLPDKCQLVYRLNREDGLSSIEISEQLNLSKRTVESHLFRALKVLKDGLKLILSLFYIFEIKKYKKYCSKVLQIEHCIEKLISI